MRVWISLPRAISLDSGVDPGGQHIFSERALYKATQNAHSKVIQKLLLTGANPNIREDNFGRTPPIRSGGDSL